MADKQATLSVINNTPENHERDLARQEAREKISSTVATDPAGIADSWKQLPKELATELGTIVSSLKTQVEKSFSTDLAKAYTKAFEDAAESMINNDAAVREAEHQGRMAAYEREIEANKGDQKKTAELKAKQLAEDKQYKKQLAEEESELLKVRVGRFTDVLGDSSKSLKEKISAIKDLKAEDPEAFKELLGQATSALANFAKTLESTVGTIGAYKTAWDTRLHGSGLLTNHTTLTALVKNAVGVSPFVKQETVMQNLNDAINQGINYNVAERAYLDTLSDSIATTFDAFSETMDKIIRVQQADSTASRLGMEAEMTEYLNSMFQNTEYLTDQFDSVTSSLYEATSLMSAKDSIGFEYQVQKWLGSLYSAGMDGSSISSIASAIGQLASGDLSGTETGAGKLLVMAASNAGLDYAKMLSDGLDGSDMNSLLNAMVGYLETIADSNKVVQTKMAGIFGLKTSDIQAVRNLSSVTNNIFNSNKNYGNGDAQAELMKMMGTIGLRTSAGAAIDNAFQNFKYTLSAGIADNPVLYATYMAGSLLSDMTGGNGISLPQILGMGTGVDLHTSVADLMMTASLGGSALSGIGSMISGIAQLAAGVLPSYGLFELTSQSSTKLGSGLGKSLSSSMDTTSEVETSYVGNSSSDDVISSTEAGAQDSKVEAMESADIDDTKDSNDLWDIDNQIYELLSEIASGDRVIKIEQQYTGVASSLLDTERF